MVADTFSGNNVSGLGRQAAAAAAVKSNNKSKPIKVATSRHGALSLPEVQRDLSKIVS